MQDNSDLSNIMKQKNMDRIGEKSFEEKEDEGITVTEREKAINQEIMGGDRNAIKALTTLRVILNALCVIPIVLTIIGLLGYILLKFLPATLAFIKRLIHILLQQQ